MAYAFIAHTSAGWRAVYWFIFAIEAAAFIMVAIFYRPPSFKTKHQHEGKSKSDLLKHLDYLGLLLFTAGLTLLLIGITWVRTAASFPTTTSSGPWLIIVIGRWSLSLEECTHNYTSRGRCRIAGGSWCLVEVQQAQLSTDPASALS